MKRTINSLRGFTIKATDGEIGKVRDFYFDDQTWKIRYLIVETGGLLSSRKVLIDPAALLKGGLTPGKLATNLTMEQVRTSPDISTDLPVSRQQVEILHKHHSWDNYWEHDTFGGGNHAGEAIEADEPDKVALKTQTLNIHLRSTREVSGYHIHAANGEIGHVNNFLLDDETFTITDLIVDTHNWIGGKKVTIDVSHVLNVQWRNYEVFLDIPIEAVEGSPVFAE